jgi:glycosyltransferase involved in cell wall biosynthesis
MFKLLLLGPITNKKNPLDTGGAVVLFENLLKQLEELDINFTVIDTNKKNYFNSLIAYIIIIFQLIFKQFTNAEISLHSSRDYTLFAPIIIILGKLFNKKTSLRKFGGEADQSYIKANRYKKKLLYFIFSNVDTLFLEMKYLVRFFTYINPNTYWFPNVRTRVVEPHFPKIYKKKFVFIGHIRKEKGIDEILEASLKLDKNFTIDLYGPIHDQKYNQEYFNKYNVQYLGSLLRQDVLKILDQYDVLLLPSYKEGYPGIVIEAYSMGLPVIATDLQGLQEIVKIGQTGILIEPKNTKELVQAMEFFNEKNYKEMSKKAYKKFDEFKSDVQTKLFLQRL